MNSYPPTVSSFIAQLPGRRIWTRQTFLRAQELELFGKETHLELLQGELFDVRNLSSRQATILREIKTYLESVLPSMNLVRQRMPLFLNAEDVPEPDLAVVYGSEEGFFQAIHPPCGAEMIVQIADSTLDKDRRLRAPIYAEAGISEYWIVNLVDRVLEVHRQPAAMMSEPFGFGYRSIKSYGENDFIAPLGASDALITVGELLP